MKPGQGTGRYPGSGRMRYWRIFAAVFAAVGLLAGITGFTGTALAAEQGASQDGLDKVIPEGPADWSELDRFLKQETDGAGAGMTFSGLMKELLAGNGKAAGGMILSAARDALVREISRGGQMAGQLLALG